MKKYFIILFIFCLSCRLYAQDFKASYAYTLNDRLQFDRAYPVWAELANDYVVKGKGNIDYVRMAVKTAFMTEKYKQAKFWDSIVINQSVTDTTDWLIYFELLCLNNQHELLSIYVDTASKIFKNNFSIDRWKFITPQIIAQSRDSSDFIVKQLRPKSKAEEYSVVPYKKGLLFVTNEHQTGFVNTTDMRTGNNYTNIALVKDANKPDVKYTFWDKLFNRDIWTEIKPIKAHDGPVAFTKNFKTAVITRNQEQFDAINKIKFSRLELKIYHYKSSTWIEDTNFVWNDQRFSNGHGVFDQDNNLIFASDRPNGFGGTDLYKSVRKGNQWLEPVNLGSRINTNKNEMFPFVSQDGTLYFSSNGWPGIGGLDIQEISLHANEPKALSPPINSFADDFAIYFVNENEGYFTSNRNDQKDQLYQFGLSIDEIKLEITLISCSGSILANQPIVCKNRSTRKDTALLTNEHGKAVMTLLPKNKYNIIYNGDSVNVADSIEFKTDINGFYRKQITLGKKYPMVAFSSKSSSNNPVKGGVMLNFYTQGSALERSITDDGGNLVWLQSGAKRYDSIVANYINHEDKVIRLQYPNKKWCMDTLAHEILFEKKQLKEFINLDLILYDFDSFSLRIASKLELDKLVKYMNERPELIVELSSHTDSWGTFEYNEILSQNRSQSCVNYILSKGINPEHIIAKGSGERNLLNNCSDNVDCSDEQHQQNRRTELKLLLQKLD